MGGGGGGPQKSPIVASSARAAPLRPGGRTATQVLRFPCAGRGGALGDAASAGPAAAGEAQDGGGGGARAAAGAAEAAAGGGAGPAEDDQHHPVSAFYGALTRRDLAALRDLLHPDITYENLAVAGTSGAAALRGPAAVADFFADALSGVERGARFEVDDRALGAGDGARAAAVWRLVSPASGLLARGVSFFRLSACGRLVSAVVDAPEHAVKTPRAGLAMAAPLAPAVLMLSESLASSLDAFAAAAFGGGGGSGGGGSAGGGGGGGNGALSAAMSAATAAAAAWASAPAPPAQPQQWQQQPQAWQVDSSAPSASSAAGGEGREAGGDAAEASDDPPAAPPAAAAPPAEPFDPSALAGLWQRDPQRTDMAALDAALELLGLGRLQRLTARLIDGISIEVSGAPAAAAASGPGQKPPPQQQQLTVAFLTSVPMFRVTERVPLLPAPAGPGEGGEEDEQGGEAAAESWWASELALGSGRAAPMGRRDLRSGRAAGVARRRRPLPGGALVQPVLEVRAQWQAPVAGSIRETYSLVLAPPAAGGGGGSGPGAAASAPELIVNAVTEVVGKGSVSTRAVYVRARAGATAAEILAEGRSRSGGSLGEAMRRQGM